MGPNEFELELLNGKLYFEGIEIMNPASISYQKSVDSLRIKEIRFNGPATIIFWNDDTKTVVKRNDDEWDEGFVSDDTEKAILYAIMKRLTNGKQYNHFLNIIDDTVEMRKWGENFAQHSYRNK